MVRYATNKAMDGLFLKVAEEEKKIRKDPIARTSEILKKVFDYAAKHKAKRGNEGKINKGIEEDKQNGNDKRAKN